MVNPGAELNIKWLELIGEEIDTAQATRELAELGLILFVIIIPWLIVLFKGIRVYTIKENADGNYEPRIILRYQYGTGYFHENI